MTATVVVVNGREVYLGGVNLSGDENEVDLSISYDEKEQTVFTSGSHIFLPGLQKINLTQKGFVTYGTGLVDEALVARMGTAGVPVSICQQKGLAGDIAYFTKAWGCKYSPRIAMGELPSFDFAMSQSVGVLIRGTVAQAKAQLASGDTLGTAYQLGALTGYVEGVSKLQRMYVAVHVFAVEGTNPTVNVKVQSDDNSGMTSPIDKITVSQITTVGSAFASVDGPITDTYWRTKVTVGGTNTPKATVFVVIGIE